MKRSAGFLVIILSTSLFSLFSTAIIGQTILNKTVPLEVARQPLDQVLEILSNKGNFYFSYNSNIIKRDSLITLNERNKTVQQLLEMIFSSGFEFRESGNYIIIRRAPIKLRLVTSQAVTEDKMYTVSGYIVDDQTGFKVSYASIYEKDRLASAMTNEQGYFKLKLKSRYKTASLTVSKEFYEDTTVTIQPKFNQQITITIVPLELTEETIIISPKNYEAPDSIMLSVKQNDSIHWLYTYKKTDSVRIEKTKLADWLLSSKLKFQTINLKKFFTARPYQASITPGLSTNGSMNGQVINNFSFNLLGGYSGGVNGFEIGGLFNIDKKDVRYVQIAGLFNNVGGEMEGVQLAGLHNSVLDSASGLQMGGINNFVKGNFTGLQVGGIYNHTGAELRGMQIAGISNYANKKVKGMQIAGIANINPAETKGVQIAGIINYTKKLSGVQIGLINVADHSDGYSFGLINIVVHGYHKLSIFSNDVMNANAAFKTGNAKLYSILLAGYNVDEENKVYSYGYGLGKEISLGKVFSINPEITSQYLHLGSWDHLNLLNKANLHLTIKLGKFFSIFGGPSYNVYYSNQTQAVAGYKFDIPGPKKYDFNNYVKGWFGWNAGINFF
jgi:hypothetical protein